MVTIAISTYNRYDIVKKMAASLYQSDLSVPHNIRIYDDCSTEYGVSELRELFPDAAAIIRNTNNLKADTNMYLFYKDFLASSDEFLFNVDSDLIFNRQWLRRALEIIRKTDGILSVFNATSHPAKEIINEELCVKETIGAAGTLFRRDRIEEIIKNFSLSEKPEIVSFDWKWSKYFNDNNVRIYCTNNSLVQHIGYYGQNSVLRHRKTIKTYFDYGRNFVVDTIETGTIINDIFEQFNDQNRLEDERIVDLLSKRPISRIKKMIKKLIRRNEDQ